MKTRLKSTLLLTLILIIYQSICYGAWIWTPETNRWLNPKHAVKDTADEQFKWAMSFYEAKDYKRAVSEFNKLVSFYPNSRHAPNAQYYIGRTYEDMEEFYRAYLAYQKVIEAYPYAKNREEIIKREYEIGLLFLGGQRSKILGVSLIPAVDKATEIFQQVVRNSPYGEYADKAQFNIGESYKKSGLFSEAIVAFQKVVDEYPKSDLSDKAHYEIAECAYLASLGPYYDQESTDKAIDKFEDFVKEGRGTSLAHDAGETLMKLKEKKAKGLFETARFYERIGQRDSASIYYKEIIDKYPETDMAKEAMDKIMTIEKSSGKKR
jgi:outer membrane assembly lipoprotein YfiO